MVECPLGFTASDVLRLSTPPKSKCPFFANFSYILIAIVAIGLFLYITDLEDGIAELRHESMKLREVMHIYQKRWVGYQDRIDKISDKFNCLTAPPTGVSDSESETKES